MLMLQYGKKDNLTGEPIKHFREIERLLTAIYCPKEVALRHCQRHSREGSKVAQTVQTKRQHLMTPLHCRRL